MRAQLDEQSVIKANAQFWDQMLAMTLEPIPWHRALPVAAGHIRGSVDLFGGWRGRIEVRLGEGLAQEATAAMLMQPVETVGEAETLDATKEIANIIAGVLKSSLPRPCTMAVPEAVVETEGFAGRVGSEDSLLVAFRHAAGDLTVLIWEQECPRCE